METRMRSIEYKVKSVVSVEQCQMFQRWNLQDMLSEYSHIKSESLAQIRTTIAEIHQFF